MPSPFRGNHRGRELEAIASPLWQPLANLWLLGATFLFSWHWFDTDAISPSLKCDLPRNPMYYPYTLERFSKSLGLNSFQWGKNKEMELNLIETEAFTLSEN